MRISAYVDGLNLYYGALKDTHYKWLDVVQLVNLTLRNPAWKTESLKYFTASVSGAANAQAPQRQRIYLNALQTRHEVSVIYGNFQSKPQWRPLMCLPIADREINLGSESKKIPEGDYAVSVTNSSFRVIPVRQWNPPTSTSSKKKKPKAKRVNNARHVQVHSMEEKGSDVNLAAHLLNDAWRDAYDIAVVVSNDRDLAEAIRLVIKDVKKEVIVLCPAREGVVAKGLADVASDVKYVRTAQLRAAQFPDQLSGTQIHKPAGW